MNCRNNKISSKRLLRIKQILGDSKASPPVPALIPIAYSTWWLWVKQGKAPQPIRLGRCTCWQESDIVEFMENEFCTGEGGHE